MSKHAPVPGDVASRQAAWQELVVLCRKCSGKRKGGFGEDGRADLRSALRQELRAAGRGRDVRILESGCLGICPKNAVVALRGTDPRRILIVPRRRATTSILEALGLARP